MNTIWQSLTDFLVAKIDPFYGWIGTGVLIIVCAAVASWFFPVLRSLAGALALGVIGFLAGYRKAQYEEQHRDEARERNSQRHWWQR